MESEIPEKKKSEEIMNHLELLDLLFLKSKDSSEYLGLLKFKMKKKTLFNYISGEEMNNEEKFKFLEIFYKILSENPDIISYYSSFELGNFCDSLYYHFIKLYMSIIISDNRNEEIFIKIKNISLKTIELLISQVSCSRYYYDYVYEFISSYYLEGNVRMDQQIFLDYLELLKKLYGESTNELNILKEIPKNFLYCQGKQEMRFKQTAQPNKKNKKQCDFPHGMTIMTWFYIKNASKKIKEICDKEEKKFVQKVKITPKSEKDQKDLENGKENVEFTKLHTIIGISNLKVCLSKDFTKIKIFMNDNGSETMIDLKPQQWYCLKLFIISKGSLGKKNDILVSVINTNTFEQQEIKCKFDKGVPFQSCEEIAFYKHFYGFTTSTILIDGEINQIKRDNYLLRKFFKWGVYNQKSLNDFNDYVTKNSLLNSIVYLFAPQNFYETSMNLEDIVFGEKISLINTNQMNNFKYYNVKFLYKYYKHIPVIGGVNVFLPFIDLLFKKKEELLTQDIFESYFNLVTLAITRSKHNLMDACLTNFFGVFGLFLEKMPKEFFTEKIYHFLCQIIDCFINNYDYLKEHLREQNNKRNSFFEKILFNPLIIMKFMNQYNDKPDNSSLNSYHMLLDKIYLLLNNSKNKGGESKIAFDDINSYFNLDTIVSFLQLLDKNKYEEYCCSSHLQMTNFFEKQSQIKICEPELPGCLLSLSNIVTLFFKDNILNESTSSLLQLLGLDISPCLQRFIIQHIGDTTKYCNKNEQREIIKALLEKGFLEIILSVFIHGLYDVKIEIIRLLSTYYTQHYVLFENIEVNYIKEDAKIPIKGSEMIFTIMKENIIPFNLLERNNFFFASLSRSK